MPNLKASESKSGRMAQNAANAIKRRPTALPKPKLVAMGMIAWEKKMVLN
jgi:hypothetical protein